MYNNYVIYFKTILMRTLIIIFCISFSCIAYTQKTMFVRVYDFSSKQTFNGEIYSVTDSSLLLSAKKTPVVIPVNKISFIKTKRSAGHNVLIGAAAGVATGALVGAASADPDAEIAPISTGAGAAGGALLGATLGAAVGGITGLLKKKETFLINGDFTKWVTFKSFVLEKSQ